MDKLAINGAEPTISYRDKHSPWPLLTEKHKFAVGNLLAKGEISCYGRSGAIEEFEDKFAAYHGAKYVLATNTGTNALHSAFFGIGIGPGDEVIAPTYTFLATVTPILQCNGVPVLCDAEYETWGIDPQQIEKSINNHTKAIVVTHMWGHPVKLKEIVALAKKHDLFLIEDCSHAHGATYNGRKVGTFGDVACFSLSAKKMVFAGEGGILITNNQEIYERATLLGHFRNRSELCVTSELYQQFTDTGFGHNYRMHPLAAAIANVSLENLDKNILSRTELLNYFSERLKQVPILIPPTTQTCVTRGAFYGYKPLFNIDEAKGISISTFIKALQAEGLQVKQPGSRPLHLLKLFQTTQDKMYNHQCPRQCPHVENTYNYKMGDLPVSEDIYDRSISFPTFTDPSSKTLIDQYILGINKIASNLDELRTYQNKSTL